MNRQIAEETAALAASLPTAAPEPAKPTMAERRSRASYARRHARYEEAARLKAMGMPLKRIAVAVGVERKTVRRWLRAGGVPLWRQPGRAGLLGRYAAYLNRRWNEAFKNLLRDSRVQSTRNVVEALARKPATAAGAPKVLVNASATGYYGPHGGEELTRLGRGEVVKPQERAVGRAGGKVLQLHPFSGGPSRWKS